MTGLRVRSWAALDTSVGGLGVLLGSMLAVLGRSWASMGGLGPPLGLRWRSWAALGAYVGDLGGSRGLSGRSWAEAVGLRWMDRLDRLAGLDPNAPKPRPNFFYWYRSI